MAQSPLGLRYQRALRALSRYTSAEPVNLSGVVSVVDDPDAVPLEFGGIFDPISAEYTAVSETPAARWQVGTAQLAPLRFHEDRSCRRFVLVGAMGAGKSEMLVRAAGMFATGYRNANIGMVAPTREKLGTVLAKFLQVVPEEWIAPNGVQKRPILEPPYVLWKNGIKFQFLAAKGQSKQGGTPIHGQDWIAAFIDEEEQIPDAALNDILMRGRAAPDGWYPVLVTCSLSDDPEFRARLERYKKQPQTRVYPMSLFTNPWVERSYIEGLKQDMTDREYRQRVLAEETKPERATYPEFDYKEHVRPLPMVGAQDTTRATTGADYLIGHDPGENFDVSLLLKCFDVHGERIWYVLDELTTERTTSEQHAAQLAQWLQSTYNAHRLSTNRNGELVLDPLGLQVLIRADPHATSDGKPDVTVYRYFQQYKFKITAAVYKKTRNPALAANPGSLQVDARVQLVNVLLKNAAKRTRLYLAADEHGLPRAARLANALAMSKRDEYFRAEKQRKDIHDLSHWPSALGFALWHYEHARIGWPAQQAAQ